MNVSPSSLLAPEGQAAHASGPHGVALRVACWAHAPGCDAGGPGPRRPSGRASGPGPALGFPSTLPSLPQPSWLPG